MQTVQYYGFPSYYKDQFSEVLCCLNVDYNCLRHVAWFYFLWIVFNFMLLACRCVKQWGVSLIKLRQRICFILIKLSVQCTSLTWSLGKNPSSNDRDFTVSFPATVSGCLLFCCCNGNGSRTEQSSKFNYVADVFICCKCFRYRDIKFDDSCAVRQADRQTDRQTDWCRLDELQSLWFTAYRTVTRQQLPLFHVPLISSRCSLRWTGAGKQSITLHPRH